MKRFIFDEKNLMLDNVQNDEQFLNEFEIYLSQEDEAVMLYPQKNIKNRETKKHSQKFSKTVTTKMCV